MIYKKKLYKIIKSLANAYGENTGNVVRRLNNGWSIAQAVGEEKPPKRKPYNAIGKKLGRLKDSVLEQVGISDPEQKKEYVHHSFRHGFVTILIEVGFIEIEFADLTAHSKSFLGRTEADRTYKSTARI